MLTLPIIVTRRRRDTVIGDVKLNEHGSNLNLVVNFFSKHSAGMRSLTDSKSEAIFKHYRAHANRLAVYSPRDQNSSPTRELEGAKSIISRKNAKTALSRHL